MNISLPGHSTPAVGTEAPLEMLAACHQRVQRQCATLQRLVPHLAAHGSDADARSAATAVMRYFDTSARDHHADEEDDLFPALIESMAGSDAVCLRELTQGLTQDHRQLERRWGALRAVLAQVAVGASVELADTDVQAFVSAYAQHIAREEAELLPMAKRLLGDAELDHVGEAMRRRRGISLAEDEPAADAHTEPSTADPTPHPQRGPR
ncbi:MAG TPA: hemerythrin domain-containing protein [Burkholderiaceae bacterium]|nr:hemerythrin domain-containing protein [Burkholderiaceae bacterium]